MKTRFLLLMITIFLMMVTLACFRETAIEVLPVSSSQTTSDNTESMVRGTDAMARRGDYILQNASVQIVVNGDLHGTTRDLFSPYAGGSIIDLGTIFEKGGNRDLSPRNDDGVNQISQSVNLNRHNPVNYEAVTIETEDERNGSLVLTGYIHDLDGTMEAAGARVDSSTRRVLDCIVITTLKLHDVDTEIITQSDGEERSVDNPVRYIEVITEVQNTGSTTLPITTVNDVVYTPIDSTNVFVPYPDWGYEKPGTESVAYPHYVHFQPRQIFTCDFGYTSRMEGLLRVRHEKAPEVASDVTFVGKARTPGQLAPGEVLTFMRELMAVNVGDDVQNGSTTSSTYFELQDLIVDNEDPGTIFNNLGRASVSLTTQDAPDGAFTIEYINGSIQYFNGSSYVDLEEGRTYPIFGDSPVIRSTLTTSSYNILLPAGQVGVRTKMVNSDPYWATQKSQAVFDDDGNVVTDDDGNTVTELVDMVVPALPEDGSSTTAYSLGTHTVGAEHVLVNMSADDNNQRDIFCRLIFEQAGDQTGDFILGTFPNNTQGRVWYLDDKSDANSSGATDVAIPREALRAYISRGPLYNVNVLNLDGNEEPADSTDDPLYDRQINIELGQAIQLPGYLSADFDARGAGDPLGQVNELQMTRFAYAEDINVLFLPNTNNQSVFEDFFRVETLLQGPMTQADADADIDTLPEYLAWSRSFATIGKVPGSFGDRGRFTFLNLPGEDEVDYLEAPLMESDPAELYDKARTISDNLLIHVSRPRAPEGFETGFLTAVAKLSGLAAGTPIPADNSWYHRTAATGSSTTWLDFDLLELVPGNHYDEYLLTRQDWFNLLNAGIFKPATGGSSTGQTKDLPMGSVRTYVQVGETNLRDNDLVEFWDSVRAGRMFVTNGPIIEATINGATYGESTTGTGTVQARIKLSGAGWVPIRELRVIVDGEVQQVITDLNNSNFVRYDGTIDVQLPDNNSRHWVVFEAGSTLQELATGTADTGTFGKANPGHMPIGFTNPIFID